MRQRDTNNSTSVMAINSRSRHLQDFLAPNACYVRPISWQELFFNNDPTYQYVLCDGGNGCPLFVATTVCEFGQIAANQALSIYTLH